MALVVKNPPANVGEDVRDAKWIPGSIPRLGRSPGWQHTSVFLPGESHGQRSLEGYNPKGHRVGWTD